MSETTTRRRFVTSLGLAATAAAVRADPPAAAKPAATSKRDALLSLRAGGPGPGYVPAAFFLHFPEDAHFGRRAVETHLEYYRATGMDFVKVQYERTFPPRPDIKTPADWKSMPRLGLDFYRPQLEVVEGLVKAAKGEALVLVTLYSAFMCAGHAVGRPLLVRHVEEDGAAVDRGLETIVDSLLGFVHECTNLGVDGFYASTQGGEAATFRDPALFAKHVAPHDLRVMRELDARFAFNILHVCDYEAPYANLAAFADYPGHAVSCSPHLTKGRVPLRELAALFRRPIMGGLERKGVIATGTDDEIRRATEEVLREAPDRFILGADCTVPSEARWDGLRTAIATAHAHRRG